MLAMLLPTTLPSASSGLSLSAAERLTTSSGAEVPKPTSVKPITKGLTPIARAIRIAPRMSASAPATSTTSPTRKSVTLTTMSDLVFPARYSPGTREPYLKARCRFVAG